VRKNVRVGLRTFHDFVKSNRTKVKTTLKVNQNAILLKMSRNTEKELYHCRSQWNKRIILIRGVQRACLVRQHLWLGVCETLMFFIRRSVI